MSIVAALALQAALPSTAPLPTLAWTGTATVYAGGRTIEIAVETTVEPYLTAVSRSWIVGEGRDRARTMTITKSSGTVLFQGNIQTLPDGVTAHERQQFALYGLMLTARARGRCVTSRHGGAPDTRLCFDRGGKLVSGSNAVRDSETGAPLAQTFRFSGRLKSNGVTWPSRIQIFHGGKAYLDLRLTSFSAVLAGV